MMKTNIVIEGDCIEVMRDMPDNSIDMIWTDPPYGHKNHDGDLNAQLNNHRGIENQPIENDDSDSMRRVVDGMLNEASRILNKDCCCCCCCCCCCGGGGPKPTFAWLASRMDTNGLQFFHSVIWDKKNPGLGWRYRRQHEMVMVSHRVGGKLLWADDKTTQRNIISIYPPRERMHPNEKPLALVLRFVELHTKPGDLILDPFAGSGTTAIACLQTGRRYICIEKEPAYVEIINKRIREYVNNEPENIQDGKTVIQSSLF